MTDRKRKLALPCVEDVKNSVNSEHRTIKVSNLPNNIAGAFDQKLASFGPVVESTLSHNYPYPPYIVTKDQFAEDAKKAYEVLHGSVIQDKEIYCVWPMVIGMKYQKKSSSDQPKVQPVEILDIDHFLLGEKVDAHTSEFDLKSSESHGISLSRSISRPQSSFERISENLRVHRPLSEPRPRNMMIAASQHQHGTHRPDASLPARRKQI